MSLITIYNPLEQFEIIPLISYYILITTSNFFFLIIFVIYILFFIGILHSIFFYKYFWQYIIESIYTIILDLVKQQINKEGENYFPYLFSLFIFILISNLLGLIPYSFTLTSQFILTASLSFSTFIGVIIIALTKHSSKWLYSFIPKDIILFLKPFLLIIEIISYLIRPFSLSIRLFANMLAGHTLLHIIASFVFFIKKQNYFIFFIPFIFLFLIILLEIGIAFIQAYVFLILSSIYINDSISLPH